MDCSPPGSSAHEDFPGKNTGVGCHALLEGIFPTQGSNPGLIADRFFYCLSHQGSQRILEWVAYPFSRGSFQPRDWTRVSFIAGGFFTIWATREALYTLPCAKQVASRDLLCTVQEAPLVLCGTWSGGKGASGEVQEEIYVHIELIHVTVQQKATEHCKTAIP